MFAHSPFVMIKQEHFQQGLADCWEQGLQAWTHRHYHWQIFENTDSLPWVYLVTGNFICMQSCLSVQSLFPCLIIPMREHSLEIGNKTTQVEARTIGGADWCFTFHSVLKSCTQMWGFCNVVMPKPSGAWPPRLGLATDKEMFSDFSLMSHRQRNTWAESGHPL